MKLDKKTIEFMLLVLSVISFFVAWFSRSCEPSWQPVFQTDEASCPQISGFDLIAKTENIMDFALDGVLLIVYFIIIIMNILFNIYSKGRIQPYIAKALLTIFYLYIFIVSTYKYYEFNPFEGVLYGFYLNTIITWIYLFYNTRK